MLERALAIGALVQLALFGGGCRGDFDTANDGTAGSESTSSDCAPGTQACACATGSTCDVGLVCEAGVCIPDGGGSTDTGTSDTTDTGTTDTGTTDTGTTDTTDTTDTGTSETTDGDMCGNDVEEGDEECDGGPGCADCKLTDFECNPLTQVDCPDGSQCTWDVFDNNFTCAAEGDVSYGNECTSMKNLYCEPGLICVNANNFPNCNVGACCSNYCNVNNGNADCFPPLECVSFWQVGYSKMGKMGLDHVGICLQL